MTTNEHELMILMFARLHEAIGAIADTLKSRDLWTGDDQRAFSHAVHEDPEKLLGFVLQARRDYLRSAARSGVVTGLETEPPAE
jgi:hypothetical protein